MPRRNSFRPLTVEALGDRRVCSANILVGMYDANLTASIQPPPGQTTRYEQAVVDGSDFDDTVQVLAFDRAGGTMTLRLQERSGGALLSDQTITLHSSRFDPLRPLVVYAKKGNDQVINPTSAGMVVDGGDGNDYLSGGSGSDLLRGGPGDDTLMGRVGVDFLYGDAGRDYLRGGSATDHLFGGDGDDILYGESGNDILHGDAGNDLMFGDVEDATTGGNDSLFGGTGKDTLTGSGGADQLNGEDDNDLLNGGAGADALSGGGGDDLLNGDAGNDSLRGDDGADSLYGGDGNDYLNGGENDPDLRCDYLVGGRGADTFVRHHFVHLLGLIDDADVFADFSSAQGDTQDDEWHW
jgi:Ca2+-binding RTX toxin-like protein